MQPQPGPHWLEMANWAAGVLVALFAMLSLRQLTILKTDIKTRNERAAKEKALEGAKLWAEAQEGFRPFLANCEAAGLPTYYQGPRIDFLFDSLSAEQKVIADAKEKIQGWARPINAIDALAALYTTGVADEATGFDIFGRDFCECIGAVYDVIAANRKNPVQPRYENTVKLYGMWNSRMEARCVAADIERKKEQLKGIKQTRIRPIGSGDA